MFFLFVGIILIKIFIPISISLISTLLIRPKAYDMLKETSPADRCISMPDV